MKRAILLELLVLASVSDYVEGRVREWYIGAVEVEWDYAPSGKNLATNDDPSSYIEQSSNRVGSIYTKAVFRQFTDDSFEDMMEHPAWMGISGPIIRGEVGDTLIVHFKNMAWGNYSIHPHGVEYVKRAEGALYLDNTGHRKKKDDKVPPGGRYTYVWDIPEEIGPMNDDPSCLIWAYHSHVDPPKDTNTGLIGPLITCKKGSLNDDGSRKDVDREYALVYTVFHEAVSFYMEDNCEKCGNPEECLNLLKTHDPDFEESNRMHTINGYVYGNLPPLDTCQGEKVAWYLIGLGGETDLHTAHFAGQTLINNHHRVDTVALGSATFRSTEMFIPSPGRWLISCRVGRHRNAGMLAFLDVAVCHDKMLEAQELIGQQTGRRVYYIAAEETVWNYAPSGFDKYSGRHLSTNGSESNTFFERRPDRIGGTYKKAHYVEYMDIGFRDRKQRTDTDMHMGIMGPPIKGQVGDIIMVIFKNKASRPYSIQPHGVVYNKENEGALYKDGQHEFAKRDNYVRPGELFVYYWYMPKFISPTDDDPDCLTYLYHSGVDPVRDVHTGLIGPLLVCKQDHLDNKNMQTNVDREFYLLFMNTDESRSWYFDDNIKTYTNRPKAVLQQDVGFQTSNIMANINGYMYSNLKGLHMCIGDTVSWHAIGIGYKEDFHEVGFNGNTVKMGAGYHIDDAVAVFPGTTAAFTMVPDNQGNWALVCNTLDHLVHGMTAMYTVTDCGDGKSEKDINDTPYSGQTRRYYIAAIEMEWDYVPVKIDLITGESLLDNPELTGYQYVRDDENFIGSKYIKALYREFTDSSFSTMKHRNEQTLHLGMMGPTIHAEVGDVIEVIFKNMASRPYSMHPHGLKYNKANEGALYLDMARATLGDAVSPGMTYMYHWMVPKRSGPGEGDPSCISWPYYSAVNMKKDIFSGLVGTIVTCRSGTLSHEGKRVDDIDREFALLFMITDENVSWYFKQNLRKFAPARHNISDTYFKESNMMHAINGHMFNNTGGLIMYTGERIAWHILTVGSTRDIHTTHFHGQSVIYRKGASNRMDVIETFPGMAETVVMEATNPGIWMLHCHLNDHLKGGMEIVYEIRENYGSRIGNVVDYSDSDNDGEQKKSRTSEAAFGALSNPDWVDESNGFRYYALGGPIAGVVLIAGVWYLIMHRQ